MKTHITRQQLIDLKPNPDELDRFSQEIGVKSKSVEITSLIGGKNTTADLVWLALSFQKVTKHEIVAFALDCSRAVEHLNQNPHVKYANDLVQRCLNGENITGDALVSAAISSFKCERTDGDESYSDLAAESAGNCASCASCPIYYSFIGYAGEAADCAAKADKGFSVKAKLTKLLTGGYSTNQSKGIKK